MLPKTVGEVMSTRITPVAKGTPLREVVRRMALNNIGAILVTDGDTPIGLFSERDLLKRVVAAGVDVDKVTVDSVMTAKMVSVSPRDAFRDLVVKMHAGNFRHLPVMEGGKVVGWVSVKDLLRVFAEA